MSGPIFRTSLPPMEMPKDAWLAIDPGSSSGALAWEEGAGNLVVHNMPDTMARIWGLLADLHHFQPGIQVVMEDVGGSMPGNAAKAARTFAEHVGALKMALTALQLPLTLIRPQIWMAELFPQGYPKAPPKADKKAREQAKKERKEFIYQEMVKQWPGVGLTKRQADAVALLEWARRDP